MLGRELRPGKPVVSAPVGRGRIVEVHAGVRYETTMAMCSVADARHKIWRRSVNHARIAYR